MERIELKEKRTANTKQFLNKDGTIDVEIYKENVHYLNNNEFKDIDNSLIKTKNGYKNKDNDFKVEFDLKNINNFINISKNNKNITLFPKKINVINEEYENDKKIKNIDKIEFVDIYDKVNMIYEIHANKLKEIIKINEYNKNNKFVFGVKTSLLLKLNEDNTISVFDNDKIIYKITKPFMLDSKGGISDNIIYKLDKKDDNYEIILTLDKEWLEDENRVYPIYVDPTVDFYEDINSVTDTFIFSGDNNTTNYNLPYLEVGMDNNIAYRTLLKFALPNSLPASYKLVSAKLRLIAFLENEPSSTDTPTICAHKITESWQESTAKWNNMYNKYDTNIENFFILQRSNRYPEHTLNAFYAENWVDITKAVKDWYNNPDSNYGIMLKQYKEITSPDITLAKFYSSNVSYQGSNPKPIVMMSFKDYNGLASYLSYSSQSHFFGDSSISNYTGNLTCTFNVANTVGGVLPVNLYLVYNTVDNVLNHDYGYGLGIKPNLLQFIELTNFDDNPLAYTDETGRIIYFYGSNGLYKDEEGLGLTLQLENADYIMTDKNDNKSKFVLRNSKYYLSEIKDTNGKTITITYDGINRITKVKDATNHEINITYAANKVTFASPYKNTEVNLTNNRITSIVSLGNTETITYYSNNLIEKIISPNGLTLKYEYQNSLISKVSKVAEIGSNGTIGDYLTFDYQLSDTKITDRTGHVNTYIFNDYGNVVGVTSLDEEQRLQNAYGKTYTFGNQEAGNVNKLLNDKALIKYVNNIVDDSSFENESDNFTCTSSVTKTYSNDSRTGNKALKFTINHNSSVAPSISCNYVCESLNDLGDNGMTYSLYLKGNGRCTLKFQNNNDLALSEISLTDEYTRYSLHISGDTYRATFSIIDIEGTEIYIDDVQLEEGPIANYYNIISDDTSDWTVNTSDANEGNIQYVPLNNGKYAIEMNSSPVANLNMYRNFNVSGHAGDVFNLSFWYKNNGILASIYDIGPHTAWASIRVHYVNEEDNELGIITKGLNAGNNNWQFFSENFITLADYDYIQLILNDSNNANDCLFTNFSLFKDIEQYSYQYDENGNLISSKDLANETSIMSYNTNNQLLQSMNPMGNTFRFEYDNTIVDRMIRSISPTGITNEIIYDENCNPIKTKINNRKMFDEIDNTKTYYIRAKGTNKYFNVDADKYLRVKTNECSYDKFYIIKNSDNQIKFKHAVLNNYYLKAIDNNIMLMYGDYENLFDLVTNQNSSYSITKSEFINDENVVKAFNISENFLITLANSVNNDYNQEFFFEQTEEKLFIESSAKYTSDGRFITSSIDSLGYETRYNYNTTNGLLNSITDPDDKTTNYTYDSKLRVTNISKGNHQVSYQYNNKNLLSNILFGTDNYLFNYDQFNRASSVKINNNTLITNIYDNDTNNLTKITYGNGNEINYTYDELNRLSSIIKSDAIYTNLYDNLGRLAALEYNHIPTYSYEYDFANRLKKYNYGSFAINYKYNKNNMVNRKMYELFSTKYICNYEFNKENALTKLTIDNKEFNYDYDVLGRLSNQNINNNYQINYKYLGYGNKTSTVVSEVNDNGTIYKYKYDKLGNVTEITKDNVLINKYTYDEYSQLISDENYITNKKVVYTYDNYGNILSKKVYNIGSNVIQLQNTYTYGNSNWQDLLTKFDNTNITYDQIGNPLSIGNKVLTWKNGRELSTYNDGTNNITFKYNLNRIRTSKIVNGVETKYYLEGKMIVFEKRNNIVLYYIYNGDEILGFVYNGNTYYYHKNIFGDIIGILNSNYQEIVKYTYDNYGNITSTVDNSGIGLGTLNPFRYRSYYYDEETGLYYLNSRYYNPQWGRFINADSYVSTGQSIIGNNMFAYCNNNYINCKDGNGSWLVYAIAATVVVGCVLLLTGCEKKKNAPLDYRYDNSVKRNCYSYAFQLDSWRNPGGEKFLEKSYHTVEEIAELVEDDSDYIRREIRRVDSLLEKMDDEYIVALKVRTTPVDGANAYHFAVWLSDGNWADKPGNMESRYDEIDGLAKRWEFYEEFYDSETILFAVKK